MEGKTLFLITTVTAVNFPEICAGESTIFS